MSLAEHVRMWPFVLAATVWVAASIIPAQAAEPRECPKEGALNLSQAVATGTDRLINYLHSDCSSQFRAFPEEPDTWTTIHKELVSRRPIKSLVEVLNATEDEVQLYGIVEVLAEIEGAEAEESLKRLVDESTSYRSYLGLRFFAQRGEVWALKILNDNYFKYPVSSVEWSEIAGLFGKYRYLPAAMNLARSVSAMSLNLGGAAHEALCSMFPDAAEEAGALPGPGPAQDFWVDYVSRRLDSQKAP